MPYGAVLFRYRGYGTGSEDFEKTIVGIEGGLGPLGLEFGYAHRGQVGSVSSGKGIHLSPYLTVAGVYFGPQWFIDLEGQSRSAEIGLNLGIKFPLPHAVLVPFLAASDWKFN